MKTGRTVEELKREVERQQRAKVDAIINTAHLQMAPFAGQPQLVLAPGTPQEFSYGVNDIGHAQIGAHVGIPKPYYDRMVAEAPDLLATNVNLWFARNPVTRLVRTLDGTVRAFLSDMFRPLEHIDLVASVLPILEELGVVILSCQITDSRLYLKAVDKRIVRDVERALAAGKRLDTLSPAVIISNSEVGMGNLSVEWGVYIDGCTNLVSLRMKEGTMKKRHVGARATLEDGESIRHLLSDETKRITDEAVYAQVKDVVRAAFDDARFNATCGKLQGLTQQPITGDVVKAVSFASRTLLLNEGENQAVLQHFIDGGDRSRYGLFNAITRAAQDAASYDRASELERAGGQIIDLPANEWRAIAEAA